MAIKRFVLGLLVALTVLGGHDAVRAQTSVNILSGSGGGGAATTPGGSDTHVQINDGGAFFGESGFTYDKVTNTLNVDKLNVGAGSAVSVITITGDGTTPDTPTANKGSVYWDSTNKNLAAENEDGNARHAVQTLSATVGKPVTGVSAAGAWTVNKFGAGTDEPLAGGTLYKTATQRAGTTSEAIPTGYSYTIPANSMNAEGRGVKVTVGLTSPNTNSKTIKIRYGGIAGDECITFTGTTNSSPMKFECVITRRSAANQIIHGTGTRGGTVVTGVMAFTTKDETAAHDVVLTISGANAGDVVAEYFIVEAIQ